MELSLCIVVCVCAASVLAFNVEVRSTVVQRGPADSMFGYAVQAHIEQGQKMILVGAPEADTRRNQSLEKPGAVYRCDPLTMESCQEVLFDKLGDTGVGKGRHKSYKSNRWLGATVVSSGVDGPIAACAPRHIWSAEGRVLDGICYMANDSNVTDVKEILPCRTTANNENIQKVCQTGFSAAISKENLFIGAPERYYEGVVISYDTSGIKIDSDRAHIGDGYLGYSMTTGHFSGSTGALGVAVGAPKLSGLRGEVTLYKSNLEKIKKFVGVQFGAYFGYSLAAGDFNGDGLDDLIVGAPMFAEPGKPFEYEHGRVYVIYQDKHQSYEEHHHIKGEVSKGRFGLSIASLGDINHDGYLDIAVGAPYGGKSGNGMVYIYQGSADGIREKYSQAIAAEEVATPLMSSFGFSLSGGLDLDGNDYTDLVVGAYKSDSVVFFRSRPIVKMSGHVHFMIENKLISPLEKNCKIRNEEIACTGVEYCFSYSGDSVENNLTFVITIDLDTRRELSKRLYLLDAVNGDKRTTFTQQVVLQKGIQSCRNITVYLLDNPNDKFTPIDVRVTYDLAPVIPRDGTAPSILDMSESHDFIDTMHIEMNCGPDKVCVPDIQLEVSSPSTTFEFGSEEDLIINVSVTNVGESAFEASFFLDIPSAVTFVRVESAYSKLVYCYILPKHSTQSTLKCDLGNPLNSGLKINLQIILDVSQFNKDSNTTELHFNMETNSTNPERGTLSDNTRNLTIALSVDASLAVIGTSEPPELYYNVSLYEPVIIKDLAKLGASVTHVYSIRNEGSSAVEQAEILFMWPYQTVTGANLMYLQVQPESMGNMICEKAKHVNLLGLIINLKPLEDERKDDQSTITSHSAETLSNSTSIDENQSEKISMLQNCNTRYKCEVIRCVTGRLIRGQRVSLALRARINATAFNELQKDGIFDLKSEARARITRLPILGLSKKGWHMGDARTHIRSVEPLAVGRTPLWVILLSVGLGILLLCLLVLGLWKCGFFRRNKLQANEQTD